MDMTFSEYCFPRTIQENAATIYYSKAQVKASFEQMEKENQCGNPLKSRSHSK